MRNNSAKLGLLAAAAVVGLAAPAVAAAQTADPAAGAGESSTVAELVVTAQKRSQSIQDVPAAISALSGAEIAARGITDTQFLQFAAPSLAVGSQNGITAVGIRGVGLGQRQGAPGVGIYVDGVYQPHPALGDITQIDLERVEVLRGPQGTLYGRNTTGGAMSFISKAPSQEFGGYLLASAATYAEHRLQGEVNVPLGGAWAARMVVNHDDRNDGFIKNVIPGGPDANEGEIWSGRLRIAGELASHLKLDLEYAGQQTKGPFDYLTLSNAPSPLAIAQSPVLAAATVTTQKFRTTADTPSDTFRNYSLYSGTLTWSSPIGDLKSNTSYQDYRDKARYDGDGTNLPFTKAFYANHNTSLIEEVLLTSKIGPLETLVGLFAMRDDAAFTQDFTFPLGFPGLPPSANLTVQQPKYLTKAYAAFADGAWSLTPKLRLIGGARYSVDKQEVRTGVQLGLVTPAGLVPVAALCPIHPSSLQFDSFTPRGGVQYDLSGDANIYGTASRGFKSGGVNASGCPNSYAPEKITAYEIGIKSRLLDRSLVLNASAFYYDYTNIQIDQIKGLAPEITNAAGATVKGVELESVYAPDRHWSLNANVTYLDATYDRHFFNVDSLNPAAGLQDLDGKRLDYSPKWSVNAGAAYTTDTAAWGRLQARVDLSYRSRTYFRQFNAPLDSQSAYTLVNLNLQWTAPGERYSVRLFANNVTDRGYVVSMLNSDAIGARALSLGTPRQVGAELQVNF